MSGRSTADLSGINDPFTVCNALMRERDALVYHRQVLERKRTELEQALQKQRSENEVCPALFVFPSAEALLMATQSDRVRRTSSTHGTAHQCVHNSAVLSSWPTPIGSGVGATGMTEYQKSFHAHYVTRTLRLVKEMYLCSANQDAIMHVLAPVHPAPMLRRLELDLPELSEVMLQYISQWETAGQLNYIAIRLHRITPTLKILCSLLSLKELNLSETCITDDEIHLLGESHTLVKIDLHSCEALTNVNPLSSIATLEVLNLSGCTSLTHVGALGKLPALKVVDFSGSCITDDEIQQLCECHTLVKINLYSCGLLTNVNSLSSSATLEIINLSRCTSLIHVDALGRLPALRELNLSNTGITDEDVHLLSECRTLVKIELFACKALTSVNPLSSIETFEVLNLSGCTSLTHMGELGRLPALKEVDLSWTGITDEEVRLLSKCRSLVEIDLSHCNGLTNVDPLSSIATLEVITLSKCKSLTHVGALGKLPVLKEVDLSWTPITDEEVRLLSECRTLVKIDLHFCRAVTNANPLSSIATLEVINISGLSSLTHVGALGKLPVLKEVKLSYSRVTDEDIRLLSKCRTLVKIDLSHCKGLTNVDPLSSIQTLEVINISWCTPLMGVLDLCKLPMLRTLNYQCTPLVSGSLLHLIALRKVLGLPSIDITW